MTTLQKIKEKETKIIAAAERIKREEQKIKQYQEEIETLQNLEIKSLLKEVELPFDEIVKHLKKLKVPSESL